MRANLDPSVWGEKGWAFLGNCLHAYDSSSRDAYLKFLRLLPEVLPCANCRRHAGEYLAKHPPENRDDLSLWLEDFRADVADRVRPQTCAFRAPSLLALMLLLFLGAVLLGLAWPGGASRAFFAQR